MVRRALPPSPVDTRAGAARRASRRQARRTVLGVVGCLGGASLLLTAPITAQERGSKDMAPLNDRPNPYQTVAGWARLPEGRSWGSTSAVEVDIDGESLWVGERCGTNSCVGSTLDPILKFDKTGKLVKSFGAGLIAWPHGITVDRQGNVWVTDGQDNLPRRPRGAPADAPLPPAPAKVVGHQVLKFSPDGKLLMALGAPGGGKEPNYFWQPNDVLVAPDGSIFVAEGHGADNSRILKFAPDGKFLKSWGKKGTGKGEFDQPHALAMDSRGRLFVGDRSNNRIQIFDQEGNWLDEWWQFSRASGIAIDKNDILYVADSESGSIEPSRKAWLRGIRIGSAKDGSVKAFIPDPDVNSNNTSAAEGVAVDRNGVIYGAEVGPKALKRYVRK
ncbi:MAG: peptidyl-alpha-hydroxyglycine alpha-amidating lyase family protein [Gemmatimonadaceae bacterium]